MDIKEAHEIYNWGWSWFQLHAQQRMQLVNFWFVAMSFLITGAVMAYTGNQPLLGALVSLAIVGSSLIFFLLDRRTQELIRYGEEVMGGVEQVLRDDHGYVEFRLVSDMHGENRTAPSYRILFGSLYLGSALFGAVTAAMGFMRR